MRRRRKTQGDEAEVDMTPMLDIVFIMLIFFIVTATFLDETGIDLTQPPPNDAPPPPNQAPAISVYVDARDLCSVDGRRTECNRVPLQVERLLADKPRANIILEVHEAATHDNLVYMKDSFDSTGLQSELEIIKETPA